MASLTKVALERHGKRNEAPPTRNSPSVEAGHPLLALQQQVGNQAVQAMLRSGAIRAKLAISQPDDPEEREADQVAARVMRKPGGFPISSPCSCSEEDESCESCQKAQSIQRRADDAIAGGNEPGDDTRADSVTSMLRREGGQPLDASSRAFFEPRFGHDFSQVRVHTGSSAAESARSVNALAYTLGSDIVFASGRHNPQSAEGRTLLAHELTHTIQQGSARRAHRAAEARIQRQTDPTPATSPDSTTANPTPATSPDSTTTDPSAAPTAATTLDTQYQAALADSRITGDWQKTAELLNGFDKEDIQQRLAQLTAEEINYLHLGAIDNPKVGPDSQVAQLTVLPGGGDRNAQLACVVRLGGCPLSRDAGIPSTEEIRNYNEQCRADTHFTGPDVQPTDDECMNPPSEPLSTGEKILLGAFLVGAAMVGVAAVVVVGAEVIPAVIAAVGEQALAGIAFYYANAVAVNEIGIFVTGLLIACDGNIAGLLKAMADDPAQAALLIGEVIILHMNISIQNGPPRPARVPAHIVPAEEQTEPGKITFRTSGQPEFDEDPAVPNPAKKPEDEVTPPEPQNQPVKPPNQPVIQAGSKVVPRGDGTFRLNRKNFENVEKVVGDPESVVLADANREAVAAELAASKPNVQRVYLGTEADRLINGTTGEELSADVVAVTKGGQYYVYESKGGDISHGLEQLEHTSQQLGSGRVVRQTLVVTGKITTPGYTTQDGVLMHEGQRVLIDGKPVYVKYTTQ